MEEKFDFNNIPDEKFEFASSEGRLHDKKLETKAIGYFKDAFLRFCKNKASIVAAIIVLILVIYAIVGPFCFKQNYIDAYVSDVDIVAYKQLPPKLPGASGGFWDGTADDSCSSAKYYKLLAMSIETKRNIIVENKGSYLDGTATMYNLKVDEYAAVSTIKKTFTQDEYKAIQEYQDENNIQLILPWVDYYDSKSEYDLIKNSKVYLNDINVWYQCDLNGNPILDENGDFIPGYRTGGTVDHYTSKMRIDGDPGIDETSTIKYKYASVSGAKKTGYSYTCRIDAYNYFVYKYGFEPYFMFGSDGKGYDIFTRLASGARFSLIFAVCVSAINLFVGAIIGAIEGYYGGVIDIIIERICEILSSVPSMVVMVLFNLHLASKVGKIPALLLAFIATGWIGMAYSTRMQFYRFKNQEYVYAARTLGARDRRIMFKHIFPNSLGTLITGSVLIIPGVIFSETSLTYLGIINLDSATQSSVGALLSQGQKLMTDSPYVVFFPALFIGLLMICFNLFGNGLRDAFNPSLRGVEE